MTHKGAISGGLSLPVIFPFILNGGAGSDILMGGTTTTAFNFSPFSEEGNDVVLNFHTQTQILPTGPDPDGDGPRVVPSVDLPADILRINAEGHSFDINDLMSQQGDNTVIDFHAVGGNSTITLVGVDMNDLQDNISIV